jgi:hypothetical protein
VKGDFPASLQWTLPNFPAMDSQRRELFDNAFRSLIDLSNSQMEACFPSLARWAEVSDENKIADVLQEGKKRRETRRPNQLSGCSRGRKNRYRKRLARGAVNDQNNLLLKQTPAEQAEFLSQVVGHGCTGKDAFYQGIVADSAYWSVRCSDGGGEYQVQIIADATEGTRYLECKMPSVQNRYPCFEKITVSDPGGAVGKSARFSIGEVESPPQTPMGAAELIMRNTLKGLRGPGNGGQYLGKRFIGVTHDVYFTQLDACLFC